MASLAEILTFLDELLEGEPFEDYGPNGLQVPGGELVTRIVTGVSAQAELFERAAARGAELVLVHHGILWNGDARRIDAAQARRLRLLLTHDMSLVAYHLPLDAHPELGNNALLADALGATDARVPFGIAKGRPVGVSARFPGDGIAAAELVARVRAATGGREPLAFLAGPARVRSIGIVSGGACELIGAAARAGLDAFLTGEPTEQVMAAARELGINFLAGGHYATETFGVRALGELLAARFGVQHCFEDIPNPI